MSTGEKRAVCLLSGGLDSTTCLAMARNEGYQCYCLSFDYGQRHIVELSAARRVASALDAVEHKTVGIDLRAFGGSALTAELDVPKDRRLESMEAGIPVTYVPARNAIFLSYALAYAEVRQAPNIFIGVNAIDYSGYPDCRPEFIAAFETMANLAIKASVEGGEAIRIHTPLLRMTKADIVRKAVELKVDLALTHTCYDPVAAEGEQVRPCGRCDACQLRAKGFEDAGVEDSLLSYPIAPA